MDESPSLSNRVIEAGWLVLAAGLPLFIAPWGRNSFELPKALLLWAVVAMMGAAWLAGHKVQDTGCTMHDAARPAQPAQPAQPGALDVGALDVGPPDVGCRIDRVFYFLPPASCILLPASCLLLTATCLLATAFSVNPLLSIQGSYDRMQGAITVLCTLALFLLVADRLREPAQVHRLLAAIAWGSAPVVAYGLLQAAGLDPLGWHVEGSPVIGTLGRSNFLGAYLVLVLPLTWACLWGTHGWPRRAAYGVLIGAQLVCLLATMARATWLGALAAGGVLVLAVVWQRGRHRLAAAGAIAGVLGLVAGLVALALLPGLEGSAGARATIWRATASLIAARPVLGYGPETFGQVFTAVFPPELVYLQGRAVLVDRAHNLVLDTLASVGVVGLLAYAVLVGTVLTAGVRALVRAQVPMTRVILAAGLAAAVGHLVETQLSFPVTATAVLFWLTLGMLVAFSSPLLPLPAPKSGGGARAGGWGHGWPRKLLAALLLLVVVPTSLALLAADVYAGDANHTGTLADLERSIASAKQATALWPSQPVYHEDLSWLHLQRAKRAEGGYDPLAEFQAAEVELDAARRLTTDDYRIWAGYGELYTEWGRAGDASRFVQAEEAYRRATALFPGSAMLHTGWGLCYVAQGRLADAEVQFHQAITLDNTDAWAYQYLGDVLLARGDLAGAEQAYTDALRWVPDLVGAWRGLGHVYRQQGQLETALIAYQRALELASGDPDLYLDVARCLWDLGRRDLACQTVERGLLLAPGHPGLLALRAACVR